MIKAIKRLQNRQAKRVLANILERMDMQEKNFYINYDSTKMPSWELTKEFVEEELSKLE